MNANPPLELAVELIKDPDNIREKHGIVARKADFEDLKSRSITVTDADRKGFINLYVESDKAMMSAAEARLIAGYLRDAADRAEAL